MNIVGAIIMLIGAMLTMIGGIGVVRFGDLMSRVHAAAKAPTLGLLLIALGAAIEIASAEAIVTLALVVVLQLLTSPVATHVLARASYGQVDMALDGADDLAEHYAALDAAARARSDETGGESDAETGAEMGAESDEPDSDGH